MVAKILLWTNSGSGNCNKFSLLRESKWPHPHYQVESAICTLSLLACYTLHKCTMLCIKFRRLILKKFVISRKHIVSFPNTPNIILFQHKVSSGSHAIYTVYVHTSFSILSIFQWQHQPACLHCVERLLEMLNSCLQAFYKLQ